MKQKSKLVDSESIFYPSIGKSKAAELLRKNIAKFSSSKKDLLLIGEAGVGKSAIARRICDEDGSAEKTTPFYALNLRVTDEKDVEATLFGYERATEKLPYTSKRGVFELANGGIVLLEELEEATFRTQLRLVSIINDRATRRLGGSKAVPVEFRLLVTMKNHPKRLLDEKKIVPELQSLLMQMDFMEVSPLRDRVEDIPELARVFLQDITSEIGVKSMTLTTNELNVLKQQTWKENLRELRAVVDRCVIFSDDGRFALPEDLIDEKTEIAKVLNNIKAGQPFILDESLDIIERGIIRRTLEKYDSNQSRTALFLGVTEQTLRYKLRRLGIESSRRRGRVKRSG
ncbi:MAG: sigma 54-interacting transcriptional regulator [Ignavibacteriales bacterium]|nr:sigma 54-interacting transcriptional regulator [Ignavibacteriales bacterium]